jgi:hypothetical protein
MSSDLVGVIVARWNKATPAPYPELVVLGADLGRRGG